MASLTVGLKAAPRAGGTVVPWAVAKAASSVVPSAVYLAEQLVGKMDASRVAKLAANWVMWMVSRTVDPKVQLWAAGSVAPMAETSVVKTAV